MPSPTSTGGGLMGYPSTVDMGQIAPISLYTGEPASGASAALSANAVYYMALPPLQAQATLSGVRVRIAAGGAGHYDVGVYDATGANNNPGNLLAHAASTNTSLVTATGLQTPAFINGNLILPPGNYWLALWIDNATDTITKIQAVVSGLMPTLTQSSAGPLPATASGLSNTVHHILLEGILSGSWS